MYMYNLSSSNPISVPKELIQNADDAGATHVRFLYDERKNEDAMTCLIDDGMRECQGKVEAHIIPSL